MKDLIVGTAGHIDHGKTALVRALTGIDTDRLLEEKRRGITIDIGFAHAQLGSYRVGFVDVPGHERFIKNMLSGIGGIRFLLLVVAADESIMPQTVEHFHICRLLQVPSGIIVITKKNQVEEELLELVRDEARKLVLDSFLESAPIHSVDSLSGEGIPELKELMQRQIEALEKDHQISPPADRMFRLPIDRVFTVKGFGTVVTGTPLGGEIHRDAPIAVYPGDQTGKVRGIQIFGEQTEKVKAGQRTALNLSGIDKGILERGMVLGAPGFLQVSKRFDVGVELLKTAPRTLRNRDPIRFHHGSGQILGRIYLPASHGLEPGEKAIAQIRLNAPTVCFPGDHFVLRRYSPLTTIGGGVVLDGNPPRWREKDFLGNLVTLKHIESAFTSGSEPSFDTLVEYYIQRAGILGIDLNTISSLTGLNVSKVQKILGELDCVLSVSVEPPLFVTRSAVNLLKEKICRHLRGHHQSRPLSLGFPREELKERFLLRGSNSYFQFLLNIWQQEEAIEFCGGNVALHGSQVNLTPDQEETKTRILELIEHSGLNTPTLDEISANFGERKAEARDILFYLIERGEIVRISGDMVLLPSQLISLENRLRSKFPSGTAFTVSAFKELFSVSRKYAIPLLELLDRNKVTRRAGDSRIVV